MDNTIKVMKTKEQIITNLFLIYGYARCIETFNGTGHMYDNTPNYIENIKRLIEETEKLL